MFTLKRKGYNDKRDEGLANRQMNGWIDGPKSSCKVNWLHEWEVDCLLDGFMQGWLVSWLRLVGWLVGWLVGCDWLVGWLNRWMDD